MSILVKVHIDGTEIWMEADDKSAETGARMVSVEDAAEEALDAAKNLHDTIRAYCTSLIQGFQALSTEHRPNKITAEFGLKLSADSKFFVVNAAGEGSIKIRADWETK